MSANARNTVILHADQEHSGLRLTIFAALFAGLVLGFFLVRWLLSGLAPSSINDYAIFLSCAGAVPVALLLIWALERVLKRVWHSGLSLELSAQGIVVHDRREAGSRGQGPGARGKTETTAFSSLEPALLWSGNLSQTNWYFRLSGYPRAGQERRKPDKWLCLATELHQDGARLNVFTLMSPELATRWIDDARLGFHRLNPTDVYEHSARSRLSPPSRPEIPNSVLHSKDGRYWLAERRRWEYGVELTPADFTTLMDYAQAYARPRPAAGAESQSIPI